MPDKTININANTDVYKQAMNDAQNQQQKMTDAYTKQAHDRLNAMHKELDLLKQLNSERARAEGVGAGGAGGAPPGVVSGAARPMPGGRRGYGGGFEIGTNMAIRQMAEAIQTGQVAQTFLTGAGGIGGALLSGIPLIGGFLGTLANTAASLGASALTAAFTRESETLMTRNLLKETPQGIPRLAMGAVEESRYMRSISKMRGVRGQEEIGQQLLLERMTGQEYGSFNAINQFERMFATEDMSTAALMRKFLEAAATSQLWNIDKGDFSVLGEKIIVQTQLMQREAQLSETVTGERGVALQMAFGAMGKGWGDSRAADRIRSIDEAIRNPANKFLDNVIKGAIIQENPNIDLVKLQDIQARGLLEPRTFGRIMQNISVLPEDRQHLFLQQFLPNLQGNRRARELLLQNRDLFTLQPGQEFSIEQIQQKILSRTGKEVSKKDIEDITTGMTATKAEDYQAKMLRAMEKIGSTLADDIWPAIESMSLLITNPNEWWERFKGERSSVQAVGETIWDVSTIGRITNIARGLLTNMDTEKEIEELKTTISNILESEKPITKEQLRKELESEKGLGGIPAKGSDEMLNKLYKMYMDQGIFLGENSKKMTDMINIMRELIISENFRRNDGKILGYSLTEINKR